jgi:hypothetical protein
MGGRFAQKNADYRNLEQRNNPITDIDYANGCGLFGLSVPVLLQRPHEFPELVISGEMG